MKINIESRIDLYFETSGSSMDRISESYSVVEPENKAAKVIKEAVLAAAKLIDTSFWPDEFTIHLEKKATIKGPAYIETVPTSLVLSRQIPQENAIRLGIYELENNEKAFASILSHEVGHMIMEWVSRKSGSTSPDDEVIPFWSKPIYEGIADFATACVTGSTLVGSNRIWFNRDILKYSSLEQSRNPEEKMSTSIEEAFFSLNLIPHFKFYTSWLNTIEKFLEKTGTKDPYSEGTWVAGELWRVSHECKNRRIWANPIRILLKLVKNLINLIYSLNL